jgi:hypothetical protein
MQESKPLNSTYIQMRWDYYQKKGGKDYSFPPTVINVFSADIYLKKTR